MRRSIRFLSLVIAVYFGTGLVDLLQPLLVGRQLGGIGRLVVVNGLHFRRVRRFASFVIWLP